MRAVLVTCLLLATACSREQSVPTPVPAGPGAIDGKTEQQEKPATDDKIRISTPQPNQTISSPFTVTGEARGPWYFEASFPVTLLDADGDMIVQTHAQAQGEWMTENFVPFESTLEFPPPKTATGTLLLQKDNPSGEPQHDDSRKIPVRFR